MDELNGQHTKKGALPFEVNHGFTQMPNAVIRHYQYYPKFNGSTTNVYAFLLSQYNSAFGYAFPTHIHVAQAVNMTEKTARGHIGLLEEVGLITITENGRFGNHTYTFNTPIEIADHFFAKFPQAAECKRKADESWAKVVADKTARKAELMAKDDVVPTETDEDIGNWL